VDIVNSCDQFEIATLKWKMNVDAIDSSGHPPLPNNDMAYKNK
jgi:hypothetical protein